MSQNDDKDLRISKTNPQVRGGLFNFLRGRWATPSDLRKTFWTDPLSSEPGDSAVTPWKDREPDPDAP